MAFEERRQASLGDKLNLFFFFGFFLTCFSLWMSACPNEEPGLCQTSYDCANDQVCVDGNCRQTCNYTSECEAGLQCFDGACVPPRNYADSGHSDTSQASDSSVRDSNTAQDRQLDSSDFDSGPGDTGHEDSQVTDVNHGADVSPATDAQTTDSHLNDAEIIDAGEQDASGNICDNVTCPNNMHCESSGDSAQCLCGNVTCAEAENCVLPETAHASGTSPICCATSEHNCDSQCVDFNDDSSNCGDCNQACDYGESCVTGACDCGGHGPCPDNFECCNSTCTDVLNDSNNCGELGSGAGCGNTCNNGQPCTEGACGCNLGTDCGAGDWNCDSGTCECSGVICAGECFSSGDCCAASECSTLDVCTNWGSCDYNSSCDESASQSRSCPQLSCLDHNCKQTWHNENQVCTRETEGDSCDAGTIYGDWSACIYAKICDETGTQTRSKTVYTCGSSTCGSTTTTESQDCTRDTDGDSCSETTYGAFGACDFTSFCDENATKTRSMTTYTCASGACTSNERSDSISCTRDTRNLECNTDYICCNESCVSSTSEEHCANCETQCSSGWACEDGHCNVAH